MQSRLMLPGFKTLKLIIILVIVLYIISMLSINIENPSSPDPDVVSVNVVYSIMVICVGILATMTNLYEVYPYYIQNSKTTLRFLKDVSIFTVITIIISSILIVDFKSSFYTYLCSSYVITIVILIIHNLVAFSIIDKKIYTRLLTIGLSFIYILGMYMFFMYKQNNHTRGNVSLVPTDIKMVMIYTIIFIVIGSLLYYSLYKILTCKKRDILKK